MTASFDLKQWVAGVAGVIVLTALGVLFPPLLIVFGIVGIVLAVRLRGAGRGLLLLGVVWLLLGLVFSFGLGTSSKSGAKAETSSVTR